MIINYGYCLCVNISMDITRVNCKPETAEKKQLRKRRLTFSVTRSRNKKLPKCFLQVAQK